MTPDAHDLHRVIAASVRELLETARLERQTGPVERLISRAAAPIELEAWFIILTIVGTAWWFGWGQGSEPVDRLYAIGLT